MNLYGIPCLQIAHGYVLAICALYTRVLQITPNPPFSLFREFLAWIIAAEKKTIPEKNSERKGV